MNAALVLALAVYAFVPFGPHVLTHAVEIEHDHDHDGTAHEHDAQAPQRHHHELQPAPESARITVSGVQLPPPIFTSFVLALPRLAGDAPAAPALLSRSLDPPLASLSPQLAARCSGNRAPPTA